MPTDPDTIAELLVENAVLATNPSPASSGALMHYFRLTVHAARIPRHPMDCVQLANSSLLGLQLDTTSRLKGEISGTPNDTDTGTARRQGEFDLVPAKPMSDTGPSEGLTGASDEPGGPSTEEETETTTGPAPPEPTSRPAPASLKRYGEVGRVLSVLLNEREAVFTPVPEGIALAYPGAIAAACRRPKEFLTSCQAQSLIVPEGGNAKHLVRKRGKDDTRLPPQYIVLAPRLRELLLAVTDTAQ